MRLIKRNCRADGSHFSSTLRDAERHQGYDPSGGAVGCRVSEADYDAWLIDICRGDQFGSAFVEPQSEFENPALIDYRAVKPVRIFESGAILLYLAEKFGRSIPLDVVGHMECMSRLFWQVGSAAYLGVVLRISITKGRSSWSTRSTDSQWRRSGSFTFSTSASPDVHSFLEKTIRLPISLAFPRLVSI